MSPSDQKPSSKKANFTTHGTKTEVKGRGIDTTRILSELTKTSFGFQQVWTSAAYLLSVRIQK